MSMQSYMARDLKELFQRDMPAESLIGSQSFSILWDDLVNDEIEQPGGPDNLDMQRVHFLTVDKPSIEIGSLMDVRMKAEPGKPPYQWKSKIVLSSIESADGNELIVTVRGD